jgi:hypothetical protein
MIRRTAALLALLLAPSAWSDDTIEAIGRKWSVPLAADWKADQESMRLLVARPQEKPRRPKQFATLLEGPYASFTLDVDVHCTDGHFIVVYAYQDDAHFNYAHFSADDPAKQPVHTGVFHVFGGDRVRISPTVGGPGALTKTAWHHVRMTWSGKTGELVAYLDGKTTGAHRGIDLSLTHGRIGLGSFFHTAEFKNLKIMGAQH